MSNQVVVLLEREPIILFIVCVVIDELDDAGYRTLSPGEPLDRDVIQLIVFPHLLERHFLLSPQINLPSPCQFASGLTLQLQVPGAVANPTAYESHTLQRRRLELANQKLEPQWEGGYSILKDAPSHLIHSL